MSPRRQVDRWPVLDRDPPVGVTPPPHPEPPDASASVALVRWPAEADERARLAAAGRPRLLVLEADAAPPLVWDDLEDWVRSPADPVEVQVRIQTLEARAAGIPPTTDVAPTLDADGIVRWAGMWVAVPPVEARLLATLLAPVGEVARRDDLIRAGWPTGIESERALDGRIRHLRRRLGALGLTIRTVRGVGFLLEGADVADDGDRRDEEVRSSSDP